MFRDRADAGRRLAARLRHLRHRHPVVLALPRGGLPVGFEVAADLEAPLDIVIVRKIGAPDQKELAIGAVAEGDPPLVYLDDGLIRALAVPARYVEAETARQIEEIARRRAVYGAGRTRVPVAGATAIVVDDGIATGATMRVALRATRALRPARLVLAVPVAAPDSLAALRPLADEIACVETPASLGAVGAFYLDFPQLEDGEVTAILSRAAARPQRSGGSV